MNALVTAARAYLGTPFRHRGRRRTGVDCVGLLLLAFRDCGVELPDFRLYGKEPHEDGLIERVTHAVGEPIAVAPVFSDQLQIGDVVVMRFSINPHHVALVGDYVFGGHSLIHAHGEAGKVVEHRFSDDQISRVTHVFRKAVP